ncbi:MAG: RDD family protein [Pseudomonadota bacterium]|nr:RDD family protein [Pseudomonadota bacterium]
MHDDEAMEYAGFWARTGATLIDWVLLLAIATPLLVSIYGWEYFGAESKLLAGPADFLISWVLPAVATVMFWAYKRATPGKMVVSAQIVDARTGEDASTGQLIGRYLAYFVSTIPLFLGIFWVAFDDRKQGWHDKLAGTVVIRPRNRSPRPVAFER